MNTTPGNSGTPDQVEERSPLATILVVDDEIELGHALSKLLTRNGYRVLTACNGEEGLGILRNEEIHLVLSDLQMPWLPISLSNVTQMRSSASPIAEQFGCIMRTRPKKSLHKRS